METSQYHLSPLAAEWYDVGYTIEQYQADGMKAVGTLIATAAHIFISMNNGHSYTHNRDTKARSKRPLIDEIDALHEVLTIIVSLPANERAMPPISELPDALPPVDEILVERLISQRIGHLADWLVKHCTAEESDVERLADEILDDSLVV